MVWTVTYDLYRGFLIAVKEESDGFAYKIFKLENRCVKSGKHVVSVERALEKARQKIDDHLADRYDIEMNKKGMAELKSFLAQNVEHFDPNNNDELRYFAYDITDNKREAGATVRAFIEIKGNGDYGSAKTFSAPDEYFDIVDNEEK